MRRWLERRFHRWHHDWLTSTRRREVLALDVGVVDTAAWERWQGRGLRPVIEPDALNWIGERDILFPARTGRYEASVRLSHPDPTEGEFSALSQTVLDSVASTLAKHTATPGQARMCVWDGYGYPWGGDPRGLGLIALNSDDPGPWPWPELPSTIRNGPKAEIAGVLQRNFVVLAGSATTAARIGWDIADWWHRPMWPDVAFPLDHSWLTYSDVDEDTIDVHGSADLIGALSAIDGVLAHTSP